MKKNWKVILLHLCAQALIGSTIIISNSDCYQGSELSGIFCFLITYIPTALSLILISFITLLFTHKNELRLKSIITLLGLVMWFLLPLIYLLCLREIRERRDRNYPERSIEEIKTASLNAAKQMGLSSYTWNPSINQVEMKLEGGKQHSFKLLNSGALHISSKVEPPDKNDTLAWLKLTLKEASVYLNENAYREIDSLVKSRCYKFSYDETPDVLSVYIFIYPSIFTGTGIEGSFSNRFATEYNFQTGIKYGLQTKSK